MSRHGPLYSSSRLNLFSDTHSASLKAMSSSTVKLTALELHSAARVSIGSRCGGWVTRR
jgi:hypothetical protein